MKGRTHRVNPKVDPAVWPEIPIRALGLTRFWVDPVNFRFDLSFCVVTMAVDHPRQRCFIESDGAKHLVAIKG